MLVFALVVIAAAPEVGSTWKWSFDDARKGKLESGPPGGKLTLPFHLYGTELEVSVDELGEAAPRRLTVKVLDGPPPLDGRIWKVESNYGEAALTEVTKPKEDDVQAALDAAAGRDPGEAGQALRRTLGTLLAADPIVAASAGDDKCGAATLEKVATAAGKLVAKLTIAHSDDLKITSPSAKCVGAGGKYTVAFTLSSIVQDQKVEFPWKGTVEVPAGAWRASLQLTSSSVMELKTGKAPIRVRTQLALRSSMKKK